MDPIKSVFFAVPASPDDVYNTIPYLVDAVVAALSPSAYFCTVDGPNTSCPYPGDGPILRVHAARDLFLMPDSTGWRPIDNAPKLLQRLPAGTYKHAHVIRFRQDAEGEDEKQADQDLRNGHGHLQVRLGRCSASRTRVTILLYDARMEPALAALAEEFAIQYPETSKQLAPLLSRHAGSSTVLRKRAPRLEEREDWPKLKEAAKLYQTLLPRFTKDAAAREACEQTHIFPRSHDSLDRVLRRMSELGEA